MMSRNIHITIADRNSCFSPNAAGGHGGGPYDPGKGGAVAPPDDPGKGGAVAPPDDPGKGGAVAPPDDPRARHGHGPYPPHACGCQPSLSWSSDTCGSQSSSGASTAAEGKDDHSGYVIVRLGEELTEVNVTTLVNLAKDKDLPGLLAALQIDPPDDTETLRRLADVGEVKTVDGVLPPEPLPLPYLSSRPLIQNKTFELPPCRETLEVRAALLDLEQETTGRWPHPGPSLLHYWRIDCRQYPERIDGLIEQLTQLGSVDLVYREKLATDANDGADISNGPMFGVGQSYLDPAPVGIGAQAAWDRLDSGSSEKIRLVDLEQRWVLEHIELNGVPNSPLFGHNRYQGPHDDGHHGTAVMGQLVGSGAGLVGIASQVTQPHLVSHWDQDEPSNGHVAEAIVNALVRLDLGPSDILLLEVQRSGGPVELFDIADATAIQLATALGVTVIEPAGNGSHNLDAALDAEGQAVLRRGDDSFRESGAIMVGAAWSTLPHDRASFSSYGSRVDCYGWGDSVLTAGYGDLQLDPDDFDPSKMYTHSFSGTSSASPIVAGAAVLVQCLYKRSNGRALTPRRLRAILADPATGTPQGPNVFGNIGVMPNLEAILSSSCGIGPLLYLRRHVGDDGVACRDMTCSCPDIFATSGVFSEATMVPGEPDIEAPAPGLSPLPAAGEVFFFVRPRNRGRGVARNVRARFYTAEVATFLWPEMWQRVRGPWMLPSSVAQGDLPVVVGHRKWRQATRGLSVDAHRAILAILKRGQGVPPFDPLQKLRCCFDWDEYRSFLGRSDVGCRNLHWANERQALDCLVTSMPGRAHTYDFQLIQRLPAGVKLTLETTPLLAALLRRSQPWLSGNTASVGGLELPNDPCFTFENVWLQAKACHSATFRLSSWTGIRRGHGLVLRQLFRGREIGRVTWYLT